MTARSAATTRWVRSLRPPKDRVDPSRPLGYHWEEERRLGGCSRRVLTVFLTGAECPFTCVFCDLWRHTVEGPTPPRAIPVQLRAVLEAAGPLRPGAGIKLYNASNFFDDRAVPPQDDPVIAELVAPFGRVTVECHPRLVGGRCFEFARRLEGQLEVALGLETIHPEALPALNKAMTLPDFDRAAASLSDAGIAVRAFVLVSPPFVPPAEGVEWAVRSVAYAIDRGATHVSLIPLRGGNGALEALAQSGAFQLPSMHDLEDVMDAASDLGGAVVTADLWDVDRLVCCSACRAARTSRLARMNLTGRREPRIHCTTCDAG